MRDGENVTYAAFYRDLKAVTQAIADLHLPCGATVAVGHPDLYVQLLLLSGYECLGIVTGSFRPGEGADCHSLLQNADLVMAPPGVPLPPHQRVVRLTEAWIEHTLKRPPSVLDLPRPMADEPVSVVRSSGTTGQPKRMVVSQRNLASRRDLDRFVMGLNADARLLSIMHFSVGITHRSAGNCLRLGATFMFDTRASLAEALARRKPTHMVILPFQLAHLLNRLPEAPQPMLPGLVVQVIGAKLPAALRQEALRKLCGSIVSTYATNETGPLGTVDAEDRLTLLPGVQAEAVGDGHALPPGEVGSLRVRSKGMITGYLDAAAATDAVFREGWFHPGDAGSRGACGQLWLTGRSIDVLNLGGVKVAAADLEHRIREAAPQWDVAVIQCSAADRCSTITICVAADAAFHQPAFRQTVAPVLPCPFTIRVVPGIPRTAEGKIRRVILLEAMCGAPASTAAAQSAGRLDPA